MTSRSDPDLLAELARRVEARQRAGDYELAWLDERAEPVDPPTPVDRFLQTPPESFRAMVRSALPRKGAGDAGRGEADQRLRSALAWLKLALDAEQAAREELLKNLGEITSARHEQAEERLGQLEFHLRALGHSIGERLHRLEEDRRWVGAALLRELHLDLISPRPRLTSLEGAESRVYSQNGEDGVLLHIFSLIGAKSRLFVEIGIGDGRECNTANLAINFGWSGLMVDAWPAGASAAVAFYASRPETRDTVTVLERTVTREDVDLLLVSEGFSGEIDLLSIDIDGNDLWVWEAIESVAPRVVVVEYNATFGAARSVSVPYDPAFERMERHPSGWYHGASLQAFNRLASRKGYVLVGCDSNGVNAFFVRADCADGVLEPVAPEAAWRPIRERGPHTTAEQFALIAGLPLVEVE